jgi:predicted nucleic acid-binding protein
MHAVADTGPLHYLVLIGHVQALAVLFQEIAIPETVRAELAHPSAPVAVRTWATSPLP